MLSRCREELEYIANTLIFVLSGAIITSRIWESATVHSVDDIRPVDFAYAILLWVYLLVGTLPSQTISIHVIKDDTVLIPKPRSNSKMPHSCAARAMHARVSSLLSAVLLLGSCNLADSTRSSHACLR